MPWSRYAPPTIDTGMTRTYMGGCLLNENLVWGSNLMTLVAKPPDPKLAGEGWRETWLKRLQNVKLFPALWLSHPYLDDYWKHGSVGQDFSRIDCPVLAVSGWADGYSNAVPRLVAGLGSTSRGVIGPWAHQYPHQGVPGPAIVFLQESLRWWDRWLNDQRNGVEDEPRLLAWMQEWTRPRAFHEHRPGRWVAESAWPSPSIRRRRFGLATGRLVDGGAGGTEPLDVSSPLSTGVMSGAWCGFGLEGEAPADQRHDDQRSLLFDSEPLTERIEMLGAAELTVRVSADRPVAMLSARLCDVAPDGASLLVSHGLLNLAHRDDHEGPTTIAAGEARLVTLLLNDAAHAFPPGHRVRLAVSNACWPTAWPSPEAVTPTIHSEGAELKLPERPLSADTIEPPGFARPEAAAGPAVTELSEVDESRRIEHDPVTGVVTVTNTLDLVETGETGEPTLTRLDDIDLVIGHGVIERFRIRDGDPLSAVNEIEHISVTQRGAWSARVRLVTRMECSRTTFSVRATLTAHDSGELLFEKNFDEEIPRQGV